MFFKRRASLDIESSFDIPGLTAGGGGRHVVKSLLLEEGFNGFFGVHLLLDGCPESCSSLEFELNFPKGRKNHFDATTPYHLTVKVEPLSQLRTSSWFRSIDAVYKEITSTMHHGARKVADTHLVDCPGFLTLGRSHGGWPWGFVGDGRMVTAENRRSCESILTGLRAFSELVAAMRYVKKACGITAGVVLPEDEEIVEVEKQIMKLYSNVDLQNGETIQTNRRVVSELEREKAAQIQRNSYGERSTGLARFSIIGGEPIKAAPVPLSPGKPMKVATFESLKAKIQMSNKP